MLNIGMCSVTFNDKTVAEIIEICKKCGIKTVEWGSDSHAPEGDTEIALAIVEKVARDNLGMYFQYNPYVTVEDNCMTLEKFISILKNVHVFWIDTKLRRYSLAENEGFEAWKKFCNILEQNYVNTNLLFEFMIDPHNPTVEGLQYEYNALKRIIGSSL